MTSKEKNPALDENQGEGNKEAGRIYNEQQRQFVAEGKVEKGAQEAKEALDQPSVTCRWTISQEGQGSL